MMVFNAFTRGSIFSPILLETHVLSYLAEALAAKVYAVASDETIVIAAPDAATASFAVFSFLGLNLVTH
jgi:hypothetical protein